MNWTENRPTETGWYWCQKSDRSEPAFIVKIPSEIAQRIPTEGCAWAGPLTVPRTQEYQVKWVIGGLDAYSPREAAEQALKIMQDPLSTAVVFSVYDPDGNETQVDLMIEEAD